MNLREKIKSDWNQHTIFYIISIIAVIIFIIIGINLYMCIKEINNGDVNNLKTQIESLYFFGKVALTALLFCVIVGFLSSVRSRSISKTFTKIGDHLLEHSIQGVIVGFIVVTLAYLITTAVDGSLDIINDGNDSIQIEDRIEQLENKIEILEQEN